LSRCQGDSLLTLIRALRNAYNSNQYTLETRRRILLLVNPIYIRAVTRLQQSAGRTGLPIVVFPIQTTAGPEITTEDQFQAFYSFVGFNLIDGDIAGLLVSYAVRNLAPQDRNSALIFFSSAIEVDIRRAVAGALLAPGTVLSTLSRDIDVQVRIIVASNPSTPP